MKLLFINLLSAICPFGTEQFNHIRHDALFHNFAKINLKTECAGYYTSPIASCFKDLPTSPVSEEELIKLKNLIYYIQGMEEVYKYLLEKPGNKSKQTLENVSVYHSIKLKRILLSIYLRLHGYRPYDYLREKGPAADFPFEYEEFPEILLISKYLGENLPSQQPANPIPTPLKNLNSLFQILYIRSLNLSLNDAQFKVGLSSFLDFGPEIVELYNLLENLVLLKSLFPNQRLHFDEKGFIDIKNSKK